MRGYYHAHSALSNGMPVASWEAVFSVKLTLRPTSLLCKFIRGCAFRGFFRLLRLSLASTKLRENVMPKSTLSLHPDHCKICKNDYDDDDGNLIHLNAHFDDCAK